MTKSISYSCNVNKQQTVCVCVHIETKLYKNMIKLSNHDHCNKFSLNNKKTTALHMKTSTKHHPKADIDASIPPSNHRSKSLHQLSWSSPYMRTSVVQALPVEKTVQTVRIHQKDSKKTLKKIKCGRRHSQNHCYPLWYTVRYICIIYFRLLVFIFKISLHAALLEKTTTKATQPPLTAMCLPKMICFFGGWKN